MKKLIYLVEKIDPETSNVIYHFGAFSSYKQANAYCEQLNEILPNNKYIVDSVPLDTV